MISTGNYDNAVNRLSARIKVSPWLPLYVIGMRTVIDSIFSVPGEYTIYSTVLYCLCYNTLQCEVEKFRAWTRLLNHHVTFVVCLLH